MRTIRRLLAAMFGLAMAFAGYADPIAGATYARLFDRAQGMLPGLTTLEQDLVETGAWEIAGGRRAAAAGGISLEAQSNTVELVWKGAFPRPLPGMSLSFDLQAAAPARVVLYGFNGDRFNREGEWTPSAKKPPAFDMKGEGFGGIKLVIEGAGLAGQTIRIENIKWLLTRICG